MPEDACRLIVMRISKGEFRLSKSTRTVVAGGTRKRIWNSAGLINQSVSSNPRGVGIAPLVAAYDANHSTATRPPPGPGRSDRYQKCTLQTGLERKHSPSGHHFGRMARAETLRSARYRPPDQLFLSIRRSILRLPSRVLRRSLAFTRNAPLSVRVAVFVTFNSHVRRRGFSSFSNNSQFKLRLIKA